MWSNALARGCQRRRHHMGRRSPAWRKERAMTSMKTWAVFVLLLALGACKLGPNYQRPAVDVPGDYRGVAPEAAPSKTAAPSPLGTVPPGTQQTTTPQQQPQEATP